MTVPELPSNRTSTGTTGVAPPTPERPRTLQVTAVVAFLGVLIALAGIAYVSTPLRTPIQDCGTAATFLIDGRVDVFANPEDPPAGVTGQQVQANNETPCQERAANRALPGAVMILVGTVLAVGALVIEFLARLRLSRHARNAQFVAPLPPADAARTPPPPR